MKKRFLIFIEKMIYFYVIFFRCCDCSTDLQNVIIDGEEHGHKVWSGVGVKDDVHSNSTKIGKNNFFLL